jgi:hypothetical protein
MLAAWNDAVTMERGFHDSIPPRQIGILQIERDERTLNRQPRQGCLRRRVSDPAATIFGGRGERAIPAN